jgi:tight adherence protein B
MIPIVLMFTLLLTACLAVVSLLSRPRGSQKKLQERFVSVLANPTTTAAQLTVIALSEAPGLGDRFEQLLGKFGYSEHIAHLLGTAGSRRSVGFFARLSAGVALACGALAHFLAGILPLTVAAFSIGALLPYCALLIRRSRRTLAFNTALPDAIDLMARALRAGHSVGACLELVGEQSVAPVGAEFLQVFQQQQCGIPFREALLQMAARVPSQDLKFLVTAILVQKETGGDLTEILTRTAHVIRERVRIAAEVKIYTAQGRLTGWILGALPVVMLGIISLVNPGYCDVLFHDPLGQKLLYTGGVCIVIGCFVISRIVDIRV